MSESADIRETGIRHAFDTGDFDAAATLALEHYGGEILGFLVARSKSASDAEEAFSMFAEDLWKGLPNFAWRCSARGWAYTLARNAANRWATSPHNRRERHETLSRHAELSQLIDRTRTATRPYLRTQAKDEMRALREELPTDDQTLLILRVDRKLSWDELALVMRTAPATPMRPRSAVTSLDCASVSSASRNACAPAPAKKGSSSPSSTDDEPSRG